MKVFDLISEYQNNYPIYKEFTTEIKSLIEKMFINNNISYLQIETRVKSLPSFLDKAYRLISNNKHFSRKFNDLIGIRLITYYNKDVYQIADLFEKEFVIHSKNSEYESQNRSPDQFGYSSKHYKISLLSKHCNTKELKKYKNIVFEVQIRTVAQHAWAAIDHKIRYKTTDKIPKDIQREIFRLSALFELADSQFLAIKEKLETRELDDLEKYKNGDLTVKINSQTLEYYFQTHQLLIQSIIDEADQIGFKETAIQHDPNSIHYLLKVFQRLGINSVGEVESLFLEVKLNGANIMKKIYQVILNKNITSIEYLFPIILLIAITLKLKKMKFSSINAEEIVSKLLRSSVKAISLAIEKTNTELCFAN